MRRILFRTTHSFVHGAYYMTMYIYEQKEWPNFTWDQAKFVDLLAEVRYYQGRLLGQMDTLGFQLQEEATLNTLTQDVIKTSEIEGEKLDAKQVRSSIAEKLGLDIGGTIQADRHVEGIVAVLLDATQNYPSSLTKDRLFSWHSALFPTGRSGLHRITVGHWRNQSSGPMRVVSGSHGHEKVHFEAPDYSRLNQEMTKFLQWFNNHATEMDLVLKSAIAHFWFVTIHPFDDGNGRIARAIADMALARSEKSTQRFYSLSAQIQRERDSYYSVLENCQKGSLNISAWIEWYLNCLQRAIAASEKTLTTILGKADFWRIHAGESFNQRQRFILNRLLDGTFYGKLTSSKWAKLAKCSQDTALRDINDLLTRQILLPSESGGRSVSYTFIRSRGA